MWLKLSKLSLRLKEGGKRRILTVLATMTMSVISFEMWKEATGWGWVREGIT